MAYQVLRVCIHEFEDVRTYTFTFIMIIVSIYALRENKDFLAIVVVIIIDRAERAS